MSKEGKRPEEVFTPRAASVNDNMYVDRPELQVALARALHGSLHIIIHGESGTGKSWLYKHVFEKNAVETLIANMANAARLGSISAEFANLVDREEQATKTSYSEKKEFGLNAALAAGKLDHQDTYALGRKEPFERCLAALRKTAGDRRACLVFDNLEAIFNSLKLMRNWATSSSCSTIRDTLYIT